MADKVLTITIDPHTDTMTVDTEGFQGKGCRAIHDAFEAMGPVITETVKPEYHDGNHAQNTIPTRH
jgi:hypothetical protein